MKNSNIKPKINPIEVAISVIEECRLEINDIKHQQNQLNERISDIETLLRQAVRKFEEYPMLYTDEYD